MHLRCSQQFIWNYTKKPQKAPTNVIGIANERVQGTHLRMVSKMGLRVQMDAKCGQLKNKSTSENFSAPSDAQESAIGTTINAFDLRFMVQFSVPLIIHLELHLKVHFKIYTKMHKKVHLRSH